MTDHAKDYGLGCPGINMGGINFGLFVVWVLNPDWLSRKLEVCDVCQALRGRRRAWGAGVWALPLLCIV